MRKNVNTLSMYDAEHGGVKERERGEIPVV